MTSEPPAAPAVPEQLRQWWQLPTGDRTAVVKLSKAGRRHPDPAVAWVAWRWAQVVLPVGAPEPGRARNIASAVGFFSQLLVEFAAASNPHDPPAPHWLDRRRARRILRLGPPLS